MSTMSQPPWGATVVAFSLSFLDRSWASISWAATNLLMVSWTYCLTASIVSSVKNSGKTSGAWCSPLDGCPSLKNILSFYWGQLKRKINCYFFSKWPQTNHKFLLNWEDCTLKKENKFFWSGTPVECSNMTNSLWAMVKSSSFSLINIQFLLIIYNNEWQFDTRMLWLTFRLWEIRFKWRCFFDTLWDNRLASLLCFELKNCYQNIYLFKSVLHRKLLFLNMEHT